ncbi:MAG: MBL fold metallo-hydrolase [Legionellaceae bacterium]|nr:MBL fold metallo-hydrolase [Legionellaceae bacterium]
MKNIVLFDSDNHQFVLLNESKPGEENGIRSNQYLIKHNDDGVLLDPGGFGVMPQVLAEMLRYINPEKIRGIILSHQDPDIVAGLNTWVEFIKAPIYISKIWTRFLPHYGLKNINQFFGIPDSGMDCTFGDGFDLKLVPAHFLHSEGQFNVYDPISKILFTGDIGTACMPQQKKTEVIFVDDFNEHKHHIEWFHRRYMCSNNAARAWVETIQDLDIQMIAPQHGPIYRGQAVRDFIEWFQKLRCGIDLMSARGVFQKEAHDDV